MDYRLIVFVSLCLLVGCGERAPVTAPPVLTTPTRNPKIPVEVSYPVIKEWEDVKRRGVHVRLNQKVSEAVLREIALEIKSRETRQYERTLIFHHLPRFDSASPDDVWATTHFDPTLVVNFNGPTIEQERAIRGLPVDKQSVVFGPWFRELGSGSLEYMTRDADGLKMVSCYEDGQNHKANITEIPSLVGRRFQLKSGTDIYEVDEGGNLRVYGHESKIIAAAPVIK